MDRARQRRKQDRDPGPEKRNESGQDNHQEKQEQGREEEGDEKKKRKQDIKNPFTGFHETEDQNMFFHKACSYSRWR